MLMVLFLGWHSPLCAEFLAGAAITDVTPKQLPVLVNGFFTSRSISTIRKPVSARSLAFSDGTEKLVIVVVDSCMMSRELLDAAKQRASEKTGIPHDRILISATHNHNAPSCMGCLGTDADPVYSQFLADRLVEAVAAPLRNMRPARIGWAEIDAGDYTSVRQWAIHPSHVEEDPFGNPTVRANMYAAAKWDHVTGPCGPEDPMLTMISVQTVKGEPIGLLANFSMHCFVDVDVSADYFGLFSDGLQAKLDPGKTGFVAMMSQGCSGDTWRHDYQKSPDKNKDGLTIEGYSNGLVALALKALEGIKYSSPKSIAMKETRITLSYRTPDKQRLEWARKVMTEVGNRQVKSLPEVYAREQLFLHDKQKTEIVVQGVRLGDHIGISTTPTETYALTGLKIKAASPFAHMMVVELANGGDGYIPPPEHFPLGGYNTWPARTAGLETEAEPKVTEAALRMLEAVAGRPRTQRCAGPGPAVAYTLGLKPRGYWRLDEWSGPRAVDASPHGCDAFYEPRVLYFLPGPHDAAFATGGINRSVHCAGGRIAAQIPGMKGNDISVSLWFWSGTAEGLMKKTEWIVSLGAPFTGLDVGDHIGLRDNPDGTRGLVTASSVVNGTSGIGSIKRWTWHHLVVVRSERALRLYLDGAEVASSPSDETAEHHPDSFFFGGSCTNESNFEGRLDEIAVFDRAIEADEVATLSQRKNVPAR